MPIVLSYSGCQTCKKALAWLKAKKIDVTVRPIVEEPPTKAELARWIPSSGQPVKKWLNTSGLSYRALGKAKVDAASEATLVQVAGGRRQAREAAGAGRRQLGADRLQGRRVGRALRALITPPR